MRIQALKSILSLELCVCVFAFTFSTTVDQLKIFSFLQMRHLFIVVDMSKAMEDQDLRPTRLHSVTKVCYLLLIHSCLVAMAQKCCVLSVEQVV